MNQAKAQNLDLSPHQQDVVAQKLKDGEVCKRDLDDCRIAFSKDGNFSPFVYGSGGFVLGVILTFMILGITGPQK